MVRLTGPFSLLKPTKVLVVGDLLLDIYTIGKARRISPEAPVAVVHVLKEEKVDVRGIVKQPTYPTPVKNRIIAENQQVVRVDHELVSPLPEQLEQQIIESLPELLQGIKVVAISDYGKGFLTKTLLQAIINQARNQNIPVIADPKGMDFTKYKGSTVIKPNLSELYAAANLPAEAPLEQAAERVLQISKSDVLMVTRSEAGISLFFKDGQRQDHPVRVREVKDVTCAGDTVLAMLTCALASGLSISDAAQLSNVAAGISIEHLGCARVSLSELARRLLETDVVNKVFDEEHLFALQQALHGRKFALLGISGEKGLTTPIFSGIRMLAIRPDWDLLLYINDPLPTAEFIELLSSLHDVDFILLKGESLRTLCNRIHPHEVYEVRKNEIVQLNHAFELIEASTS